MDKSTFVYLLIETVLFLIPIITLAVKLGGVLKVVKGVENFPEWKAYRRNYYCCGIVTILAGGLNDIQ